MEKTANQEKEEIQTQEITKPYGTGMTTGSRKQTHTGLLTPQGE